MHPAVDFSPTLGLLLLAALAASLPLAWIWLLRPRGQMASTALPSSRLALLCGVTLFLTFDLIVFGAFTRLTDSGLGCPDWPGCYGHASPIGAAVPIAQAESALPSGPVTLSKAWIEMIHRYLAMIVGALILVMAIGGWRYRQRLPHSPWWPTLTLAWVIVQGLFGKYTVTLKLYPAVVTLHLLGGLLLLMLLAVQRQSFLARPLPLMPGVRALASVALATLLLQSALGGWVSTNYAVLACSGFPACNGQWWPEGDFARAFTLLRELGRDADGSLLPLSALVAIHWTHRLFALLAVAVAAALVLRLWHAGSEQQRFALGLAALLMAQVLSGLSNVVLGWPMAAALAHSAGAAALVYLLTTLLARSAVAATVPRATGVVAFLRS